VVCLSRRGLTLRCTRLATAGFARLRERVNSNVMRRLSRQSCGPVAHALRAASRARGQRSGASSATSARARGASLFVRHRRFEREPVVDRGVAAALPARERGRATACGGGPQLRFGPCGASAVPSRAHAVALRCSRAGSRVGLQPLSVRAVPSSRAPHNPSIERTVSGKLRLPATAVHFHRYAAA
jgi:hypothetical protein